MPDAPDDWLQELEQLRLPALAYNVMRLKDALSRPATGYADLGRIVCADPGLAVELFRELARSPNRPREPIHGPTRIISLLGRGMLGELVGRVPVLEERYRPPALDGLRVSYSRAVHAATIARRWETLRGRRTDEEEVLAALLQGLGEMALWAKKPGTMSLLPRGARRLEELDGAAHARFGASIGQVGERLAGAWSLPEPVILAQRIANSHLPLVQTPLLAASIAWTSRQGWDTPELDELTELAADLTHLDEDMVRSLVHRDTAEAARAQHAMGLPHLADRLLSPPGDEPAAETAPVAAAPRAPSLGTLPPRETPPAPLTAPAPIPAAVATPKPDDAPEPAPRAAATSAPPPGPEPTPGTAAASQPSGTARTAARGATAPDQPVPPPSPLQQRLGRIMREMRDTLGLERVMFAMITPERTEIRARFVVERKSSGLRDFRVSARERNLFSLILVKQHAVWINSGNQVKYLPLIPEAVAGLISVDGFFLASVFAKGKPVGLFYADAAAHKGVLDDQGFASFKKFCQRGANLFGGS